MENNDRFKGIPLCKGAPELGNACGRCARCRAPAKFQSGNEEFEAVCRNDVSIAQALAMLDPTRAYSFKHAAWVGWLAREVCADQLPYAWFTDDHLADKSATTYDLATMERWKAKGWPVTPMYLSPKAPASLLGKGFTTLETGDGKYRIITQYKTRDDAWSDYTALCKAEQPAPVDLLRDALDHIARTCHQSRQQSRRIRWIEARANGALEGKPYDAKLLDLPVEVDREIDRMKRRDSRQVARIRVLEALLLKENELLYAIQGDPGAVPSSAIDAMRGEVFTALNEVKP